MCMYMYIFFFIAYIVFTFPKMPQLPYIAIALLTISDVPWLPCCSHTPPGTKSLIGHPLRPFPREKPSVELLCWQRQGPWMPRVGNISGL